MLLLLSEVKKGKSTKLLRKIGTYVYACSTKDTGASNLAPFGKEQR